MSEPEWYTQAKAKGLIVEERGCSSIPLPPTSKPLPMAPSQVPQAPAVETKPRKPAPLPTSKMRLEITVENFRLHSTANMGGKMKAAIARKLATKSVVKAALPTMRFPLPCIVVMTRLGGKGLDPDDNLPMAFKSVKDVIADWLGLPNDKDKRVKWRFRQQPAYVCGFKLTFLEK